jgi:hypothetical protein
LRDENGHIIPVCTKASILSVAGTTFLLVRAHLKLP